MHIYLENKTYQAHHEKHTSANRRPRLVGHLLSQISTSEKSSFQLQEISYPCKRKAFFFPSSIQT